MSYYTDPRRYFAEMELHSSKKKVLVEGDSWFSIPDIANVPIQLDGKFDLSMLCLATPGNRLLEMTSAPQVAQRQSLLADERFGQKWDVILLSAGGNDVLGPNLMQLLQASSNPLSMNPQDYLNQAAIESVYAEIRQRLESIMQTRDASGMNAATPIVIHSYSYLMPRNYGHHILMWNIRGPWVLPQFLQFGIINPALQQAICSVLTDRFYAMLCEMAAVPGANLHVVDVRATIPPVEAAIRDLKSVLWDDELHPSSDGYAIITEQGFVPTLKKLGIV